MLKKSDSSAEASEWHDDTVPKERNLKGMSIAKIPHRCRSLEWHKANICKAFKSSLKS